MRWYVSLLGVVSSLFLFTMTWAYTEAPVTNGGHVTGKVTLLGKEPLPKAFNLVTFPNLEYCGRISTGTGWRLLDQFDVAPDGGLAGVVVMVEGVEQGKPFHIPPTTVVAKDCTYFPDVTVVREQQEIEVVNMDPIVHDVQMYEMAPFGAEVVIHRPLRLNPYHPKDGPQTHAHLPGEPLVDIIHFTKGRRIFLLECGFHAYMQTWGVSVTNPYYAVTDKQGNFTIENIPEGVYTLVAWHPGMGGILDAKVVVLADDTLTMNFEYHSSDVHQSPHTTMVENPHFEPKVMELLGATINVVPDHEVQKHH